MKFVVVSGVLLAVTAGLCSAVPSLRDALKHKEGGSIWALLVAGSNTWMNYRHQVRESDSPSHHTIFMSLSYTQADVCHAYQVLHAHGVPDDHIVVMMYDDIANNEE